MVEVLRVGRKNVVTCGKCGSELRIDDSDVRLEHRPLQPSYYDDPEPEDHYRTYVVCPVCKAKVPCSGSSGLKSRLIAQRKRADDDFY
jgi:hypothetical protein